MKKNLQLRGTIAVASAVLWVASVMIQDRLFAALPHLPGTDFIFIPSGVRFIVILTGGMWAAMGVFLGSLYLSGPEFGTNSAGDILLISICFGFGPYVAMRMTLWIIGVEKDLRNLAAPQLPLIGLGVAVGATLFHTLLFSVLGAQRWNIVDGHFLAMVAVEFVGILLAVMIIFLLLRLYRRQV